MRYSLSSFVSVLALFVVASAGWPQSQPVPPQQPIQVRVVVSNTQGIPVSGAHVELKLAALSQEDPEAEFPFQAQTDEAGGAILTVSRPGPAERITVIAPTYLPTLIQDIGLENGSEVAAQVERGGTLKGIVRDAQGRHYPDVQLMVTKVDDDDVGPPVLFDLRPPVRSGAEGAFVIEGLSSGLYTVFPYYESGGLRTVELDHYSPPVHVTEDGVASTLVHVSPLGSITGVVELALAGPPPANVLVTPIPADATELDQAYISEHQTSVPTKGSSKVAFVLPGLRSGGYRVEIEAAGYAPLLSRDKGFLSVGGKVSFPAQVMEQGVEVEGLLRTHENGAPVVGSDIHVFFPGIQIPISNATSGQDGSFRFGRLMPGSYQVRARSAGLLPFDQIVEVREGTAKASLDLRLRPGAALEGAVIDDGKLLAGIEVWLSAAEGEGETPRFDRMYTDVDGTFRFLGMPAGRYHLYVPAHDVRQELSLGEDEWRTLVIDVRNARPLQ